MPYFGLLGNRLPSTEEAVPQSDRWCRNLLEAVALENRRHCRFVGICPAFACGVPVWVVLVLVAAGKLVPEKADSCLAPAVVFGAVWVGLDRASGFAGSCHRVVEHTGYTCLSPGKRKIDSLRSQNRGGYLRHSGGPHGIFQLFDPLAA